MSTWINGIILMSRNNAWYISLEDLYQILFWMDAPFANHVRNTSIFKTLISLHIIFPFKNATFLGRFGPAGHMCVWWRVQYAHFSVRPLFLRGFFLRSWFYNGKNDVSQTKVNFTGKRFQGMVPFAFLLRWTLQSQLVRVKLLLSMPDI